MTTTTWIHCGTGDIQLLKDRLTRKVRFFSQRRSTKEVTGNHLGAFLRGAFPTYSKATIMRSNVVPITSDTKFQPNKGYEERSWVWVAKSDYSNNTGVPRKEVFAVRFKTGAGAAQSRARKLVFN